MHGLGQQRDEDALRHVGNLEDVRDEVPAVEHLSSERFFDLADRCDLALDDE
jgi:hypothetical protein